MHAHSAGKLSNGLYISLTMAMTDIIVWYMQISLTLYWVLYTLWWSKICAKWKTDLPTFVFLCVQCKTATATLTIVLFFCVY